ncbi:hypothetical protein SODALDRAFT_329393 [Sodiomyces alkalinus F11]|uniref:TRAF-type zinc finger protein n=1 Tax=Sodiomyces alkalinus (strain CBS 110278 / VKM F-3762 / F11) TaxID=1314773 RepID=A0A3N2PL09_SODAK|nr:hypothetical protein SODALDRAFT_329393 [Sodiomyces alkalinus F11]ROT35207.1 hypothetical protein SODALDRAFT_329393 [Sodiomyces alkalinus F11]
MPPFNSLRDPGLTRRLAEAIENASRLDDDESAHLIPPSSDVSQPSTGRLLHQRPPSPSAPAWPTDESIEPEHKRYPLVPPERVLDIVDFHGLAYVDDRVDDNLLCPICKMPFVTPVTTPCDHTFCFECLRQACETRHVCPIDRKKFRPKNVRITSRLLRNQLDSLVVACPNAERGCGETMRREDVAMHTHKCDYTLAPCPDAGCAKKVATWLLREHEKECLHTETACPYCDAPVEKAVMEDHIRRGCLKNTTRCDSCGKDTRKSDLDKHVARECPEADAACDYAEFGCRHRSKRKLLAQHHETCVYRICLVLGETVKRQEKQLEWLRRENEERDRLLGSLRRQQERQQRGGVSAWEALRFLGPDGTKACTAEEAVMGIYEEVERRIEGVQKDLTELDGRQMVMVLNEMMPIKNEMTEIRTNLGILKMHVAWLMNRSREELERSRLAHRSVAAGGSASGSGTAGASSSAGGNGGSGGGGGGSSGGGATGTGISAASSTSRGRGGSDSEGEMPMMRSRRPSDGSNGIPRL